MAIANFIVGLSSGTLLGLYFRVSVLIPVMLFASAGIACSVMASGGGVLEFMTLEAVSVTSIQVGYVMSCILRLERSTTPQKVDYRTPYR